MQRLNDTRMFEDAGCCFVGKIRTIAGPTPEQQIAMREQREQENHAKSRGWQPGATVLFVEEQVYERVAKGDVVIYEPIRKASHG